MMSELDVLEALENQACVGMNNRVLEGYNDSTHGLANTLLILSSWLSVNTSSTENTALGSF